MKATIGVLLVQLGTPASPEVRDVRRFLRSFLSDPRVIDLPAPLRRLLVDGLIAPLRAPKSARAYRSIWLPQGSPLLVHSRALAHALSETLGANYRVALGMRYGEPYLAQALQTLARAGVERIVAAPLFPQNTQSSLGSASERVRECHALLGAAAPPLTLLGAFANEVGYIHALAEAARPALAGFAAEHVLFSYHGVPERHVRKADPGGAHCLLRANCCDAPCDAGNLSNAGDADNTGDTGSAGDAGNLSNTSDDAPGDPGYPVDANDANESGGGAVKEGGADTDDIAAERIRRNCYRAQCLATSRALAAALGDLARRHSTAFQSRLGPDAWLKPATFETLRELSGAGVRRLAVLCPSFTADCLETLEEIGIRAREHWRECGGEALLLAPCLNAHPAWVEALAQRIRRHAETETGAAPGG